MTCLVCGARMEFSFKKVFDSFGLGAVDYWTCCGCGFTASRTHSEMSPRQWQTLNELYHRAYQGQTHNPDDPRWIERLHSQVRVIEDAAELGLLDRNLPWIDYACGDGKLSDFAQAKGLRIEKYERYLAGTEGYLPESSLVARRFGLVLSTSVIEHLRTRDELELINGLVGEHGVLGLHTVVCEQIPRDPTWFYLLPVHCAFHTNRSMAILFKQWGYTASVYNVDAKLWFWFRRPPAEVCDRAHLANNRPSRPSYIFKEGFVDYWK